MKNVLVVSLFAVLVSLLTFASPVQANKTQQFDDPVEQGRYLVHVAGCIGCHTPYANPATLEIDESRLFSGGNLFSLGPAGVVYTANITPDETTGIGAWTDEEIKNAIRLGLHRDGSQLFPIMPYMTYNKMADSDISAIVAYLRTLPPINNLVPERDVTMPPVPPLEVQTQVVAPDPSDEAARGVYLVTAVMACNDCHTALDPETGQPMMDRYMAGGQPYEGPWGVVYGTNITPHEATGIGDWSDAEIGRAIREGIHPDGRRMVVMPWREYKELTDEDLAAVTYFLRNNIEPIENSVPDAALNEEVLEVVEIPNEGTTISFIAIGGGIFVVILALVVVMARRKTAR